MKNRKQSGFSILELMVVLVILGLIMGVVGPKVIGSLSKGQSKTAKIQIENMSSALDMYRLDVGAYPTSGQGLAALVKEPSGARGWSGPYLKKGNVPVDPWGGEYQYKRPGKGGQPYDLFSLGSDGSAGGSGDAADITLWES